MNILGDETLQTIARELLGAVRKNVTTDWTVKESARALYEAFDTDPMGVAKVLDIKPKRKYDLDKQGIIPATPAQLAKLRSLGVTTPDGLSKWGASKMIDRASQEEGTRARVSQASPDHAGVRCPPRHRTRSEC